MACSKTAFIEFKDCESSYLFEVGLTPSTSYFYEITDKFGNVYQKAFTTDEDGYFSIYTDDFPPYLFTSAAGKFTLTIKESQNSCTNLEFVYCDSEYETIVFSFTKIYLTLMPTCEIIRTCLGISDDGSESSFLNEKGEFKTYQELLSYLPSYASQEDAIADSKSIGFWYYNTTSKAISKIGYAINEYSAGVSIIDFIPDGSNGWDLSVVANPTTVQIPSGQTIDSCHVEVIFWSAGIDTSIYDASITINDTINTGANGAGLYEVLLTYNVSDGSTFQTFALYVVDATDTILHYYVSNGVTVNSVSGLVIGVSADIDQSGAIANEWFENDGTPPSLPLPIIGSGESASLTVSPTSVFIGQVITLDSNFSDYANPVYISLFSVTIN